MNSRTFGVEIECGYCEDGISECRCECECYECAFCRYGCDESLGEDEECSCECSCETCYLCEWGCEGGCSDYDRSLGCEVAADLLASNGFSEWTHDIHPDGSGVEIPSPVLCGRTGLNELQRVMTLLQDNGFYADELDGLHVHHGAEEWKNDAPLIAHTIELWEENDELIRRFVDPARRGTDWARSRKNGLFERERYERFKQSKSLDDISLGHYYALNMDNLDTGYGSMGINTIEFRLHEGTLDYYKAAAWIRFGQAFLEFAKRTHQRGEIITCGSRTDLLRRVGVSSTTRRRLMAVPA